MMEITELSAIAFSLTEAFKMAGFNSRYAPIMSIVLATGFALLTGLPWTAGLIAGLMASGLYAGVKSISK